MADVSDVEDALVALVVGAVYPGGTGQPSAITAPVQAFRGWPKAEDLRADLPSGKVKVSVFPRSGERNATRHPKEILLAVAPVHTITATVSGAQITFSGTIATPQYVTVIIGGAKAYSYPVKTTDTLTSLAASVAALIDADIPATSSGAVVTVSTGATMIARVGAPGTGWIETRRQARPFQVTIWAGTPSARDAAAKAIDPVFANTDWLALSDGSAGRVLYMASYTNDDGQNEGVYRRDLIYSVEYPTLEFVSGSEITVFQDGIQSIAPAPGPVDTSFS
ncbi:hypothetical protein [Xanthobacter versatilis]|uniref:hypothetical protein n=1 Tax=Xanthobacter autotrophicus (strain ATCC BAA-1158 / Py2) TaxID=78245 RepID=UPI00372B8842